MLKKKTINPKIQTAQDFVNVQAISDGILFSKHVYIFGYIRVNASDNKLMSEKERDSLAARMAASLSNQHDPWQLLSIPRTVDTLGMIENLTDIRRATEKDARLKLINGEIAALKAMMQEGVKEPLIVIKCWTKAASGTDKDLKRRLNDIRSALVENQVSAEIMTDQEITYLCKVFADLNTFHPQGEEQFDEDIPVITGTKRRLSRQTDDTDNLLSLITPMGGIVFGESKVTVGTVAGRIYGATRFSAELDYGWAVDLMNSSNCITCLTYTPGNASELGDALSKSIRRSLSDAEAEHDVRRRMRLERQAKDGIDSIESLDSKNAAIGHLSILVMPFTDKEEEFENVCRSAVNLWASKKIKLRPLGCMQKDAYKQLSPYYIPQPQLDENRLRTLFPLETLTGGFPMTVNIYRDSHGCYFARTMDGNIISLDLLFRGKDRTNGSIVALGKMGGGKSTALKHIIETLYMIGVKIIIVDPEGEYRELCMNLDGSWLDAGGGTAIINPLQILPVAMDDEQELPEHRLYQSKDNAMALHLHTLEVFWKLRIPSLTDVQLALVKKSMETVYNKFGITWDTDVSMLTPEQFPIHSDLYDYFVEQATDDKRYDDLAILFYDISYGADSYLWNGHTNLDMSNNFICLDTKKLLNSSDNLKRAQYFNIMGLCWREAIADPDQPVMIIYDEVHIILDPAMPQTAMSLRNQAKRCRKYESMVAVATHSVVDFLDPAIKLYGQAILDVADYKLLFRTDGKNLKETAEVFNLTETEQAILESGERGRALMLMGKQHVHVNFDIPQYKLDLMGKAGGR